MEVLLKKENGVGDAYKKYRSFCQKPELRSIDEDRWLADVFKRTLLGEAEDRGIRRGLEQGREEGMQQGMQQGRTEGNIDAL